MTESKRAQSPPAWLGPLIPFASRPRLTSAIGIGVLIEIALNLVPNELRWSTRAIFAWDATCLIFLVATFLMMADCDSSQIKARAESQDEGQHVVLLLAVVAAIASVITIGFELSLAKADHGVIKGLRVALAFATVIASWLFVQMIFALHYAHEFYAENDASADGGHRGGLAFPGEEHPDYWDFLHFSAIIGVAGQTADVAFTSRTLRRTGTVHGMVAFAFNTVVLALTINLLAGLF